MNGSLLYDAGGFFIIGVNARAHARYDGGAQRCAFARRAVYAGGLSEHGGQDIRPKAAARAAARQHHRSDRRAVFGDDLSTAVQRERDAFIDRARDVALIMVQRKAHQHAARVGIPVRRARSHQRGQKQHALRAGAHLPRHIFDARNIRARVAAAQQVFQRPVKRRRAGLHRAANVAGFSVRIEEIEYARLGIQHGMLQYLRYPCAGADIGIGVAGLHQPRAARRAAAVAAADGDRRAGDQPGAVIYVPRNLAANIVSGDDARHAIDIHVQILQKLRRPAFVIDVQRRGERCIGIIGKAEAAGQVGIDVVLDVHEPLRPPIDIGQVFLEPHDLRQGVMGVQTVAGQRVEVVFIDYAVDFLYLRARAAIGMDDVRVQRAAFLVHGNAAVHRAAEPHARDALGTDLLQQFSNAVENRVQYAVGVLLRPVRTRIQRGIIAAHGGQRFAFYVEYGTFTACGTGVAGQYQVFFHGFALLTFLRYSVFLQPRPPLRRSAISARTEESGRGSVQSPMRSDAR